MKRSSLPTLLLILTGILSSPARAHDSYVNPLGMRFMEIPAGEFTMGSTDLDEILLEQPDGETLMIRDETPAHRVVFPHPFYLGQTEVTQSSWLAVMGTRPGPEAHWSRPDWEQLPVVSVSWLDVQKFLEAINQRDSGARYRLPSEAEWEYAARAAAPGIRPFPMEELERHAWYIDNSSDRVQAVATRATSAWGLHDMFGNAWEWVNDWYAPNTYQQSPAVNPAGPAEGTKKIRRGGSYHCPIHLLRPAYRSADTADTRYSVIGFRLVAMPVSKP